MNEILYYPLIDCDTEGTEKAAMFPAKDENTVKAQSDMWLVEIVPCFYRLHAKSDYPAADGFTIRCPLCGKAMKCISGDINESARGLYVCRSCVKE